MPLLDHFHPPLYPRHRWHGFHNAWATYLAAALNRTLPQGYFAAPNVQFAIEIDTVVLRKEAVAYTTSPTMANTDSANGSSPATDWHPLAPSQTVPFEPTDDIVEVLVYGGSGDPMLVGAIELISPANKDRHAQRSAFTAKCEAYLRAGVGLLIVDLVTNRTANLHYALLERLGEIDIPTEQANLYVAAYHPMMRNEQPLLDLWYSTLTIGQELPPMPLWLRGGPCMRVDVAETYARTCHEQRILIDLGIREES